jgi:ubiquitin carboxyl-terminal hydrolase 25/28
MFFESAEGNSEGQAPVESVFVHPIIGVEEEGKDLYDCLGELYLTGSEIEYEGKKGYIMDLMDQFPPMLYIQMRVSDTLIR